MLDLKYVKILKKINMNRRENNSRQIVQAKVYINYLCDAGNKLNNE